VPQAIQVEVVTQSKRRCALCFGLEGRTAPKSGQIAHIDRDATNNDPDNLAYLCRRHADKYDSVSHQTKRLLPDELKAYKGELLEWVKQLPLGFTDRTPTHVRASREKLPLAVFEMKRAFYRKARELIIKAAQRTTVDWNDIFAFNRDTDEAIFFFGKDVEDYFAEIQRHAIVLHTSYTIIDAVNSGKYGGTKAVEDFPRAVTEHTDEVAWFAAQLPVLRQLLGRYIFI
jgi:hypothetical protein